MQKIKFNGKIDYYTIAKILVLVTETARMYQWSICKIARVKRKLPNLILKKYITMAYTGFKTIFTTKIIQLETNKICHKFQKNKTIIWFKIEQDEKLNKKNKL